MSVALSVTNSVVAWPLWRHGNDAQRQKYLQRLARSEILGAFCLTEPQAGSDAAAIEARAVHGGESGVYLVFAKTDPAAGTRGITAFLIEPAFSGFRVSRYEDKMGLRSSRSAEIVFCDCEVREENRLGQEGKGMKIALEALEGGRVGIAAQAVGLAQGALEASANYAKQRR